MILPARAALPSRKLLSSAGITRVARITGLDRTGVEVASALRPGGHVLQLSNGKGRTFLDAARAAVSEASELAAAERLPDEGLRFTSTDALVRSGAEVWLPEEGESFFTGELVISWREAQVLGAKRPVQIPACVVHCPPADAFLGPTPFRWSSNGLAAHPQAPLAVRHALRELVERDQLGRALPGGFTEREVAARLLSSRALQTLSPTLLRERGHLLDRGFDLYLLDVTPTRGFVGLPVAAALLFDHDRGPVPLTAGYACRPTWAEALDAALLEAAQSRLTDIHGAREDVAAPDLEMVELLHGFCEAAEAASEHRVPRKPAVPRAEVPWTLGRLRRVLKAEVAQVTLQREPLPVVKLFSPALKLSELL